MRLLQKTKYIFVLLCMFILTTSCENWLSVSPKSEVQYDDMFSHKNGFKDQITGVYTALCSESLYGANLSFGMVDALGQQYVWTQEIGEYYYFNRFLYEHNRSIEVIKNIWNTMYNAIANVNILLKGIEEHPGVLSPIEESCYKGEALALRAFLHFDILRLFGKSYVSGANEKAIPYVSSISKDVTPLSTVAQTIDLIIKDLEMATSLLEDDPFKTGESTTTMLGTRVNRFNYYAAKALLARAYLYKNDKQNALLAASEVIESGSFPWILREKVTTTTRDTRDGIFLSECIFMLNNTMLEDITNKYLREGSSSDVGNLLMMSSDVRNEIFESDLFGGYDWRYIYYFETQKQTYWGNTKLWQYGYNMPKGCKNNLPIIRVSEMYLIAAECATSKSDAVAYFNELRQHRGFAQAHDISETISDEALLNEITKEYRKEFVGEGQWFFHCKRMDKDLLPNLIVPFQKEYYVLPMPDMEIEYGGRK